MAEKEKDPQKELELALGELEERVDRLRALYEQYFMGYEKVAPSVQRKDVDRRFGLLRKQQIRNTALRFRFNVITQRFNTYATYWARVTRQIEEGTFKRHVTKAKQRFGPNAQAPGPQAERTAADDAPTIDVDLDEELDLDTVLAEADASAEARSAAPHLGANAAPAGAPIGTPRPLRPAAMPPGSKPRIVLRRSRPDADPTNVPPGPAPTALDPSVPRPAAPIAPGAAPTPARPAGSPPMIRRIAPNTPDSSRMPATKPIAPRPGFSGARPAASPVKPVKKDG